MEQAGRDRAGDSGGQDGRDPDKGIFDNIAHLQHRCADTLGDDTAPFVLFKGHHGKADHLGAAAGNSSSACQSGESQGRADRGGGNRQGQRYADDDRNDDPHKEGLKVSCPHDNGADTGSRFSDGGRDQGSEPDAGEDRHQGGDKNIDPGLFGDSFSELGRDDRDEKDGERSAGTAHLISSSPDCDQGEEDKGRSLEGISDRDSHRRAAHGRSKPADIHQGLDPQLRSQRIEDGADEQRSEQTLCHSPERIDPVAPRRDHDVFAGKKALRILLHNMVFLSFIFFPFFTVSFLLLRLQQLTSQLQRLIRPIVTVVPIKYSS